MKHSFVMLMGSFLPLAALKLFSESNALMAQPQMPGPQMGASQPTGSEGGDASLASYELPAGPITADDMPRIQTVIEQVLGKISASKRSAGSRADNQTIHSGILLFQEWLKRQGCITDASTTYNLEETDKYADNIFITYPGQLPFDIVFNMAEDVQHPYRLLIFVTSFDLFTFASLVENRSIEGVAVPPHWPKDPLSYWEDRP